MEFSNNTGGLIHCSGHANPYPEVIFHSLMAVGGGGGDGDGDGGLGKIMKFLLCEVVRSPKGTKFLLDIQVLSELQSLIQKLYDELANL